MITLYEVFTKLKIFYHHVNYYYNRHSGYHILNINKKNTVKGKGRNDQTNFYARSWLKYTASTQSSSDRGQIRPRY